MARWPRRDIIDTSRDRPIFILGCPRSGTTLLGLMMQAHPKLAIPPENRFLLPSYFNRESWGDLAEPENRRRLGEFIVGTQAFDTLGLDSDAVVKRIVDEAWTVGSAVGLVLRAYADRFGKIRWGDKRPNYRNHFWVIRRMFPNAQFVHIIRDGRDCVASMWNVPPWDKMEFYPRICAWNEAVDHALWARDNLDEGTYHELQYENLVTEPEKQLRALCEFLGEEFDEAMLRPNEVASQVASTSRDYHVRTHEPISTSSIGRFRERLEPWQLELCEAVMRERLETYGYDLTGAAPPSEEHLKAYRRAARRQARKLRAREQQDRARADAWPVADMSKDEAAQRREVTLLQRKLATLERRNAALRRERDTLRIRLDEVTASRTWRWTGPLRRVGSLLHRRRADRS